VLVVVLAPENDSYNGKTQFKDHFGGIPLHRAAGSVQTFSNTKTSKPNFVASIGLSLKVTGPRLLKLGVDFGFNRLR